MLCFWGAGAFALLLPSLSKASTWSVAALTCGGHWAPAGRGAAAALPQPMGTLSLSHKPTWSRSRSRF